MSSKVTLGASTLRISLPVFVAAERGLFGKHGLEVELRPYPTAQPMVDDVVLGRLDAAGYAAWPILVASSQGANRPVRAVTAVVEDEAHRLSYVLGRKGAGASGLSFPSGARGKRVGILPTIAYQRWLDAILREAGVAPAEVQTLPLAPPLQVRALGDGAVDFLFTNDPMATAALASGVAEIVDDGPPCARRLGTPFSFGGFVLSGALADDRPDVARRLVEAIDEAIAEVRRDPAAARAALGKHVRADEAAWSDRYPDARYFASGEQAAGWFEREIAQERKLGILGLGAPDPRALPWSPRPPAK